MKRIACGFLSLLALSWSAGFAEEGVLVLVDEDGEEVLRLDADQMTTGEQQIPAGRYLLKVDAPGVYKIKLLEDVEIEVKRGIPEEAISRLVEFSPVLIDFDLESGDQHRRGGLLGEDADRIELQLVGVGLPEIYGWSATVEYDPQQVRYVGDSFKPGDFLPEFIPLVDVQEGRVQVGGANFSKTLNRGDGDLGYLSFDVMDGFEGKAELVVTQLNFRKLDSIDVLQVEGRGMIVDRMPEEGDEPEEGEGPEGYSAGASGEEALSLLMDQNACPECDLREADLMQENLREADLRGANLSGANLFRTDLSKANLEKADLTQANLLQTKLRDANLKGADLSGARMVGANLVGANLEDAVLDETKLSGAQLSRAIWIDGRECGQGSVGRCK